MSENANPAAEMVKAYEPAEVEARWYARWKASGIFHAEPDPERLPYCICIPPPNITGSLHMGHALNNSILDAMTRWHRMRGFCALCLPGTDHASIATQAVVERELAKQGLTAADLGREKFIERCWEWRDQYGTRIYHQLERLGCSYDWERARFTMDASYVDAIMEEFRIWYERGLIYRGTRVVNWDVRFQSAVSDIEVNMETRAGKLYSFRYPFADGSGFVTVATTRPETMLGDSAVAANPSDERYIPLFGKTIRLPLVGREIQLIADDYAKPEFGSGAVKVTPAHDLDDFECGLRHNLPQIVVIGKDGRMTSEAGEAYEGLDRFEARKKVLADMEALGLLEKTEDYTIQTPVSDRSGEVIEPLLSEQWFVDMEPLAAPAMEAIEQAKIRLIPERYRAIILHWLQNIRPWCISRQLWWGHRIPVWWTEHGANRQHAFARTREEAVHALGTENVWQDEDVLDTWFSSGLWPQATLGWPVNTPDLGYFYPTNLLSTAQEILYLWVARMIVTGLDFVKRPVERSGECDGLIEPGEAVRAIIPFRDVYVHATVLDAKGQRMSKSKGNGVDPIDLIERYGADAARFSLLQQAGKNQDIRFSEAHTEQARNFCNKLWNASRFVLMNLQAGVSADLPPRERLTMPDRWILSRLNLTIDAVNRGLGGYDMDDATRALYAFFWSDFCDWYVEMAKPRLRAESADRAAVQSVLAYVLETTLRLLHPMIPFITEEIWQALCGAAAAPAARGAPNEAAQPGAQSRAASAGVGADTASSPFPASAASESGKGAGGPGPGADDPQSPLPVYDPAGAGPFGSISLAPYPQANAALADPEAEAAMEVVTEATRAIRNLRAELGIPPGAALAAAIVPSGAYGRGALTASADLITSLARLSALDIAAAPPRGEGETWVSSPIASGEVFLRVGDALDIARERERIDRELEAVGKEIDRCTAKLGNAQFVERAKLEVVETERRRLAEWEEKRAKLEDMRRLFGG